MAIRSRISDEAKRKEHIFKSKGMHPLLRRIDSPHRGIWQTIVENGNARGGITAGNIQRICHQYHPQPLADLIAAKLVIEAKRIGNQKFYVANPKGVGVLVQTVTVVVNLYERADGTFVAGCVLLNKVDSNAPITRKLLSRKVHLRVPYPGDPDIEHGMFDEPDEHGTDAPQEVIIDLAPNP